MKNTITVLLLMVFAGFIFTSCSVTKRRYLPGYYVHKNTKVKSNDDKLASQSQSDTQQNQHTDGALTYHASRTNHGNTKVNKKTTKPIAPKEIFQQEESKKKQSSNKCRGKQLKEKSKHKIHQHGNWVAGILNPSLQQTNQLPHPNKYFNDHQYDDGNIGLKVIGWILIILGLLVLLFASILIGAIVMLLGLVFVVAA